MNNGLNLHEVNKYIDTNSLSAHINKLECISLLATSSEFQDNQYAIFLQSLQKTISENPINSHIAKSLDFNIFCTSQNHHLVDSTSLSNLFKNVNIISINIPDAYNFYNKLNENSDLTYGSKSGPNYSFFQTFKFLDIYNTTLFLECDCYLSNDWLKRIYKYTRFSGSFWISGATYDGHNRLKHGDILNQHINGGVCLYATGCPIFKKFIDFCFDLVPSYISVSNYLPYDYIIYKIIEDHFNKNDANKILWQFIKRQYTKNNLIYNYSTKNDHDIKKKISDIIELYNPAIVHKKMINCG